jgi:dolichol-phosphate mannosyltransferase
MLYSIIIPTYNERENLPILVYLIEQAFFEINAEHSLLASGTPSNKENVQFEVIVVDDASPDRTQEVVRALQDYYGSHKIRLVARPGKLGLGTAYKAGLAVALGERVILMDADLSHHPKHIRQMIQVMDRRVGGKSASGDDRPYDIVTGTRYKASGGVAGWSFMRKLTSQGANVLATILLSPGVSDLTGSFRLYKKSVLQEILPQVKSTGYAFQMEIMVRAKKLNYTVAEVPIVFVDRLYGESKLGTREIVLYLKGLCNLFFTT